MSNSYRKNVWLTQTIAVESHIVASGAVSSGKPSTHPVLHMDLYPREVLGCVLGNRENKMPATLVCDLVGNQWSSRFGGWLYFFCRWRLFSRRLAAGPGDYPTLRGISELRSSQRAKGLRFRVSLPDNTIFYGAHRIVLLVLRWSEVLLGVRFTR